MDFRRFVENDWLGFAGAECFDDGSDPLIAGTSDSTHDMFVVIDKNGMDIIFTDIDNEENNVFIPKDNKHYEQYLHWFITGTPEIEDVLRRLAWDFNLKI